MFAFSMGLDDDQGSSEGDQAEPFYAEAQAIRKQMLGERHPDYARSLENRFICLPKAGNQARINGEPLLRQALEIRVGHAG